MESNTVFLKSPQSGIKSALEFFIRNECALQIAIGEHSVVITFYKGVWEIGGTQMNHHYSIHDNGEIISESPTTKAFINQRFTTWLDRTGNTRQAIAMAIVDGVAIHYGEKMFNNFATIHVHQLGRNSVQEDGKILCSPKANDTILYRARYE